MPLAQTLRGGMGGLPEPADTPPVVTLSSGAIAIATVEGRSPENSDGPPVCVVYRSLLVNVPHDPSTVTIGDQSAGPFPVCPAANIQVHPFLPAATAHGALTEPGASLPAADYAVTSPVAGGSETLCEEPTSVVAFASQPTPIQGAWEFGIAVTNHSPSPCLLDGYPTVSVTGGSTPMPATDGVTDFGDDRPTTITLPPGKSAAFNLQLGPSANAGCARATGVEVGLPQGASTTTLLIPAEHGPTPVCATPATVSAFYLPVY